MSQNTNTNNSSTPQLDANNLKVISDQLKYEATMNKKASQYADTCTDQELKNLCRNIAQGHKQNYTDLLNYLNSHQ
ncbi:MAG: hypothetical protein GX285_07280 [Clostridiales bacterium]|nr:hypothetical protein [Clostridiales bacterium]